MKIKKVFILVSKLDSLKDILDDMVTFFNNRDILIQLNDSIRTISLDSFCISIEFVSDFSIAFEKIKKNPNYSLYIFIINNDVSCLTKDIYDCWHDKNRKKPHFKIVDFYYEGFDERNSWIYSSKENLLYINKNYTNFGVILAQFIYIYFKPIFISSLEKILLNESLYHHYELICDSLREILPFSYFSISANNNNFNKTSNIDQTDKDFLKSCIDDVFCEIRGSLNSNGLNLLYENKEAFIINKIYRHLYSNLNNKINKTQEIGLIEVLEKTYYNEVKNLERLYSQYIAENRFEEKDRIKVLIDDHEITLRELNEKIKDLKKNF